MYDRDNLLSELRLGVVEVTFTKANGERREMRCTLRSDLLPPSTQSIEEKKAEVEYHDKHKETIACWDADKQAWRSFRMDSIIYVQLVDSY